MSVNTDISLLDSAQIIKRTFDVANDATRVVLGQTTGMDVELNADDGDSIEQRGMSSSTKASLTSANTGTIIAAMDCKGIKSFQLYTNTTSTITGAQVCTVQVSPSDTDNVWIATSLTITPNTTNGTVVAGTVNNAIVARRVRVVIAAAISSGTFDIYLNLQGV